MLDEPAFERGFPLRLYTLCNVPIGPNLLYSCYTNRGPADTLSILIVKRGARGSAKRGDPLVSSIKLTEPSSKMKSVSLTAQGGFLRLYPALN